MPWDLRTFDLREMLACGLALRKAARGGRSMEQTAQRAARFFRDGFRDEAAADGDRQCVLARVYRTMRYDRLDPELRAFADRLMHTATPAPAMRCLCLLASAGDRAEWNDRRESRGHQAIPLPSPEMVEQAPMIAGLARQFGLELSSLVSPSQELADLGGKTYGVFHVEEALGSSLIPAQNEFVVPFAVRSVVGFGGGLRSGDIFAVILFTRVPVTRDAADRFRSLALDVKTAFFDFDETSVFEQASPAGAR
jgi:hypothetical protein